MLTLKSIEYSERLNEPLEWSISGLELGQINLLVGKNATGKSRTLNLIASLAKQLKTDKLLTQHLGYRVVFDDQGVESVYELVVSAGSVVRESLVINGEEKLHRDEKTLRVFAEKMNDFIEFEPSNDEVAAAARKDKLQHPYLLPLNEWAKGVRWYHFGSGLGKGHIALMVKNAKPLNEVPDDEDESKVVAIFDRGRKQFGKEFVTSIRRDMRALGYDLSEIRTATPDHISFQFQGSMPDIKLDGQIRALCVKERGVRGMYFQDTISQGMFRALSILIQVTYSQMAKRAHCIVIDDIGEGLDFDRSSLLITMLREKALSSQFQLIMATNDQFVMNNVPLEEWSVLQRSGCRVQVRNVKNSKKEFEEFRFIGMSNFALFEMDFLNEDANADEAMHDE